MVVPATPDLVVDAPAAQPPAPAPAPAASSQVFDSLEDLFKTNGASSQPATAADTAPPKTETAKTDQPDPEKPATQQAAAPEMDADALERLAQTDPNAFRTWVRAHHDHPLAKLVQAEASDQARRANQRAVAAAADATKAPSSTRSRACSSGRTSRTTGQTVRQPATSYSARCASRSSGIRRSWTPW
jgi:ribonuclease HI